ncbi:hypothetical protein P3T76_011803 [Phytophthora citrophthora]|uniref:FYVE-type domain-containing protein n=1 Tax=Phytophthora citrophthora TaxID=4793 RepID=A0AAD9G7Z4_9STRA|nr:hypothetical protein P3T76_011803 [Phytophthora citrophthora]
MKGVTPFDSVLVSSDQFRRFERKIQQLLDETLREFDTHISLCKSNKNPLQDKWQWKPLKTHEGLSVFKERQPTHPELNPLASRTPKTSTDSSSSSSNRPTTAVAMAAYTPEMAMVMSNAAAPGSSSVASTVVTGHVNGSLSDVLYGLLAVDTADLQLQLRYMTDAEVLDSTMLNCIQPPTATDPFRFVGLQWIVRGESSRVKASGKRPRDFVLLVASGVVQHKSQEIGYYLCQSVELQECGELELQGLTRGWLSTCSLFTEVNGTSQVNVFSRGFADFKGKLQDYQAANMMTTLVLNGLADAATCGQSKKLNWLLHFKGAAAEFRRLHPQSASSGSRCGICERKFGVLHSAAACNLCQVNMCSRCRVSRELSFVKRRDPVANGLNWEEGQAGGQVRSMTVVLCKNCKMNANHMDAKTMASREVQGGSGAQEMVALVAVPTPVQAKQSHSSETKMSFWTPDSAKQQTLVAWTPGTDKQDTVKNKAMDSGRSKLESSVSSFASTLPSPRDQDSQEDSSFELTPYQPQYVREDPEISYTYTGNNGTQADLVRRMQELQMKSESVYKFTSQMNANTRFRHQQFEAPATRTSISELD